ncbi:MAG: hypothetical protein Q7K40_03885 [bacterium]|nr:hypothetical protein [bacterium]
MNKSNFWKYIVGTLGVACCAVPIWLFATAGVFSFSLFTEKLEIIVLAGITLVVAIFLFLKKKKAHHGNTCAIECECGKHPEEEKTC